MGTEMTQPVGLSVARPRDRLTGLAELASAREMIDGWMAAWPAEAGACPIHAMLVSVGRIDTVNIAYGESTGDHALIEIAHRIGQFASDELESAAWIAARAGGGTFLIAARDRCSRERWQWLGEALADAIAMPIETPQHDGVVRLWPRVALMRTVEGEGTDQILDQLAQTLELARQDQGRRVAWVAGETARIGITNQQLEADLLAAIDRAEIEIVFQPQYSLADDRLTGAEALARWQHPEIGRLGANTLFTLAERTDHVAQLSRHIAERALFEAARSPGEWRLSINVTPADLASGSFADEFASVVHHSGFPPARLTLEITEQVLLAELEYLGRMLEPLKERGMKIALDDFGAGYSNFRYLKHLPVDSIKLDRSMVEGIAEDPRDRAILQAIVAMARALDMSVVAEGVEEEAQRAILAQEGVATYQGFLKSLPLPLDEFRRLAAI